MITTRLSGDTELRRLEKLPSAAERRIAGALVKLGLELQAVTRDKPSGNARGVSGGRDAIGFAAAACRNKHRAPVHQHGFSDVGGIRADLRRTRRAFRPIAAIPRDMRAPGRRMKLAERSFPRSTHSGLEPAIRSEIEDALREVLR